MKFARQYMEDITACFKGMMLMIDSTVRTEVTQVPPDTAVAKKPMTLKRLRKAQRVQDSVKHGKEDVSKSRVWPPMETEQLVNSTVPLAESMILDLGSDPTDFYTPEPEPEPAPPVDAKGKPIKPKKGKEPAPAPVEEVPASVLPPAYVAMLVKISSLRGNVSTAHRMLVNERDNSTGQYVQYLHALIEEFKEEYDMVLRQEASWNERWRRQVGMLRQGAL